MFWVRDDRAGWPPTRRPKVISERTAQRIADCWRMMDEQVEPRRLHPGRRLQRARPLCSSDVALDATPQGLLPGRPKDERRRAPGGRRPAAGRVLGGSGAVRRGMGGLAPSPQLRPARRSGRRCAGRPAAAPARAGKATSQETAQAPIQAAGMAGAAPTLLKSRSRDDEGHQDRKHEGHDDAGETRRQPAEIAAYGTP